MRVSNDKFLTGKFLCFGWVITYERWSHMEAQLYTNSIGKKLKKQILQIT